MAVRTDFTDGWMLRLAEPDDERVPPAVRAALPIPASVPGTVHTDLLDAGLIPDPYLDRNEELLDWIGRVAWVYERGHRHDVVTGEEVVLAFDGLDTIATVTVNGTIVATTANMHRRYEVPISDALSDGDNTIAVRFDSAWDAGAAAREAYGDLPGPYPTPFNFVRKMACNFGWDWGPQLVTAGIWRPVTLIRSAAPRLGSVLPRARVDGSHGTVAIEVAIAGAGAAPLLIEATVGPAMVTHWVEPTADRDVVEVRLDHVQRWWPVGLGEQPLYDATVRLSDEDGRLLDSWSERIGFRSVRLDTAPDADGTPFVIVVNDVRVPVRGANWIPDDAFPSRVTERRVRTRIRQAADAGINLLRVWGGGVYESRDFYRACDEAGVLVWQDFLFACAAYPEDEATTREVEAEAVDNVGRLLPHPSLALWNGNNENIWGHEDWDWKGAIGDRAWGAGYYFDLLPRVVASVDRTRPYWPGSPWSGSTRLHPNDPAHALVHLWDAWNEKDYTVYGEYRARFVSEFGWQAPPTWSTLTRAVHDDPLTPTSPGVLAHQKAIDGNGKLERGLAPHLPVPTDVVDWHFATQLNQARAIAFGIEHFRSLRPLNAGTIVWQLNDCWPVTSWAAIDGDGRRKPLWYALRASYAARLLTIQPRDDGLALVAVNDTREPWADHATVRRLSFDGAVLAEWRTAFRAGALGAATVMIPGEVASATDAVSEVLVAETAHGRAFHFYAEDVELAYRDGLTASVARDGEDAVVTLEASALVRDACVFADRVAPAAEADAMLVALLPGESRRIRIRGVPAGRDDELVTYPVLRSANDLVLRRR